MNTYLVGSVVRFTATVKNIASVATDADAVMVRIKLPSGTVTASPATHDGAGQYHYDYEPVSGGIYHIRFETTNPDAAAETAIEMRPSIVT